MTSRAHGGSSLEDGVVEIMQNRRLFRDDGNGLGTILNESDERGKGYVVSEKYFLQFFNQEFEDS